MNNNSKLNELTDKLNNGEITLEQFCKTYNDMFVDDLGVVRELQVDAFLTDYYHFKYDKLLNKYYITNESGFSLTDCPSDFDLIDEKLFDEALECYYRASNTYGVITFHYNNLIENIEMLNNSLD